MQLCSSLSILWNCLSLGLEWKLTFSSPVFLNIETANSFSCFPFWVWLILQTSHVAIADTAKWLQSCPTLCDPRDGSPPGSPVPGILQARTLEWVAISFSNVWKWKVKVKLLSRVRLLATPWTAAHQAPPSMGFSRQEDWSGVPLPSPVLFTTHSYVFGFLKESQSFFSFL